QTASPLASRRSIAQRAYRLDRSASARYVRRSPSDNSAGASPSSFASSSMTIGKMRSGLRAMGAVSSSARDHARAADGVSARDRTAMAAGLLVMAVHAVLPASTVSTVPVM